MKKYILIITIMTLITETGYAQPDTLHVYGPGGPFSAINECAKLFTSQTGIPVQVIAGPEPKWIELAKQNADIIYGGAEYMLTQFIQNHPGMVDVKTRTELYKRPAAILVRPGNPKKIKTLKDLATPGVNILDVNGAGQLGLWEDIAGKANLIGGIQNNITGSFANTALGIAAWKENSNYDAWITYASWYNNLKDITQIVPLPDDLRVFRGTPIALTATTRNAQEGKQFILFLLSAEGHKVFKKWGWE